MVKIISDTKNAIIGGGGKVIDAAKTKTIKGAIDQIRSIIEIAANEIESNPIGNKAVTIGAGVTVLGVSLHMQVEVPSKEK